MRITTIQRDSLSIDAQTEAPQQTTKKDRMRTGDHSVRDTQDTPRAREREDATTRTETRDTQNSVREARMARNAGREVTREADAVSANEIQQIDPTTPPSRYKELENALPYPLFGTADSLRTVVIAGQTHFNDVTAETIFGAQSALVPSRKGVPTSSQSLSENAIFQGFVLTLAVVYATLIYHHMNDIRVLVNRVIRGTAAGERIAIDHGNNINPFINIATAIGMLFVGIVAVRYSDLILTQHMIATLPYGATIALSLIATLVFALIACYQVLVVRAVGIVTRSQPFIVQLMMLKRTYFTLIVISVSPTLLLYALTPGESGDIWIYVMAAELAVAILLYLRDTLNLFVAKKISIMHWFLYLCAVDIFPFSFIWLLGGR